MLKFTQEKIIVQKIISLIVFCAVSGTSLTPGYSYAAVTAPVVTPEATSAFVPLSMAYQPVTLVGIKFYPDNPLKFDFIINKGDARLSSEGLRQESTKLIKHFLAALTIPENDLWVNLSPYESQRIITDSLGQTEMGKDLLAQDYLLKQLSASITYPESAIGKNFWQKVYSRASNLFGRDNLPLNTFNKIWIVPERADIYEDSDKAVLSDATLKVMMEADYLAMEKAKGQGAWVKGQERQGQGSRVKGQVKTDAVFSHDPKVNDLTSAVMKETVVPLIEQDVNQGKDFAQLRQVYTAMLMAVWFKHHLWEMADSVNGQKGNNGLGVFNLYCDKRKTKGIETKDHNVKEKIYRQYLEAYKKGVYNYIKKEFDPVKNKPVRRRYFSGGCSWQSAYAATHRKPIKTISSAAVYGYGPDRRLVNIGVALAAGTPAANTGAEIPDSDFSREAGAAASAVGEKVLTLSAGSDTPPLQFSLGSYSNRNIRIASDNGKTIVLANDAIGKQITIEKIAYGDATHLLIGGIAYLVLAPEKPFDISLANIIVNSELLDFLGTAPEDVPEETIRFPRPTTNPNDRGKSNGIILPIHIDEQPEFVPETATKHRITQKAKNYIGNLLRIDRIESPEDFKLLVRNAFILGTARLNGGRPNMKAYYEAQNAINTLSECITVPEKAAAWKKILAELNDFLILNTAGVGWEDLAHESHRLRHPEQYDEETRRIPAGMKVRPKTFLELPVDPEQVGTTPEDAKNWEIASINIVDTGDPEITKLTIRSAIRPARSNTTFHNVVLAGGASAKPILDNGLHKITALTRLAIVEEISTGRRSEVWMSNENLRTGIMMGQNPKSRITMVTGITGHIKGLSDLPIRQSIESHYPGEMESGQIDLMPQRTVPVLDPRPGPNQGYDMHFSDPQTPYDGHLVISPENHMWALMKIFMNKRRMLRILEDDNGIMPVGNSDNVLLYGRQKIIECMEEARANYLSALSRRDPAAKPLATIAVATQPKGDKKFTLFARVKYRNKITDEERERIEIHHVDEFPVRTSDEFYGIVVRPQPYTIEKNDRTEIQQWKTEQNRKEQAAFDLFTRHGLFLEDLTEKTRKKRGETGEKQHALDICCPYIDAKLYMARIFGIPDELINSPGFIATLKKIDQVKWRDAMIGLARKIKPRRNANRRLPSEDGSTKIEQGYVAERGLADLVFNGLGVLKNGRYPALTAQIILLDRPYVFLPLGKGTEIDLVDASGTNISPDHVDHHVDGDEVPLTDVVTRKTVQGRSIETTVVQAHDLVATQETSQAAIHRLIDRNHKIAFGKLQQVVGLLPVRSIESVIEANDPDHAELYSLLRRYRFRGIAMYERRWLAQVTGMVTKQLGLPRKKIGIYLEQAALVANLGRNVADTKFQLPGKVQDAFDAERLPFDFNRLKKMAVEYSHWRDSQGQPVDYVIRNEPGSEDADEAAIGKFLEARLASKYFPETWNWNGDIGRIIRSYIGHERRSLRILEGRNIALHPYVKELILTHHDLEKFNPDDIHIAGVTTGQLRMGAAILRFVMMLNYANRNTNDPLLTLARNFQRKMKEVRMVPEGQAILRAFYEMTKNQESPLRKKIIGARRDFDKGTKPTCNTRDRNDERSLKLIGKMLRRQALWDNIKIVFRRRHDAENTNQPRGQAGSQSRGERRIASSAVQNGGIDLKSGKDILTINKNPGSAVPGPANNAGASSGLAIRQPFAAGPLTPETFTGFTFQIISMEDIKDIKLAMGISNTAGT